MGNELLKGNAKELGTPTGRRIKPISKPGGPEIRLLRPGVYARYLEGDKVISVKDTPTALAETINIRPAKFVLWHRPWDNMTYGIEGYRNTIHAFASSGYEVNIGDGWGQYEKAGIKPYAKFDVRKATKK